MHILRRRGWEISESRATPEAVVLGRRGLGARRVAGALMQGRVEEQDRETVAPDVAEPIAVSTSAIDSPMQVRFPFGSESARN